MARVRAGVHGVIQGFRGRPAGDPQRIQEEHERRRRRQVYSASVSAGDDVDVLVQVSSESEASDSSQSPEPQPSEPKPKIRRLSDINKQLSASEQTETKSNHLTAPLSASEQTETNSHHLTAPLSASEQTKTNSHHLTASLSASEQTETKSHHLTASVGEDITAVLRTFALSIAPESLSIVSAKGSLSSLTVYWPPDGDEIQEFKGDYNVTSLSNPDNLHVSFDDSELDYFGAKVAGPLIVASPFQLALSVSTFHSSMKSNIEHSSEPKSSEPKHKRRQQQPPATAKRKKSSSGRRQSADKNNLHSASEQTERKLHYLHPSVGQDITEMISIFAAAVAPESFSIVTAKGSVKSVTVYWPYPDGDRIITLQGMYNVTSLSKSDISANGSESQPQTVDLRMNFTDPENTYTDIRVGGPLIVASPFQLTLSTP